jgi:transposase
MNPQMIIDEKILIISLYNECNNYREVGEVLNRDKNILKKWINSWKSEGTVLRKVGSGFNSRTTADDENIIYTAVGNRKMKVEDMTRECDLDICCITVSQRLRSGGLKRRLAAQKEKLNENHIQGRLNFARNYSDLTVDEWS